MANDPPFATLNQFARDLRTPESQALGGLVLVSASCSGRATSHLVHSITVKQGTYISTQLRESVPYLCDAGFRETATLLTLAADEIEKLRAQVLALEQASQVQTREHRRPDSVEKVESRSLQEIHLNANQIFDPICCCPKSIGRALD